MSKSQKMLSVVVIAILVMVFTAIPAFAATYDRCADSLNELGLFQGTTTGYDLESSPNRVQAAVMMVRLLGQEEAALAADYAHPFTDVPSWADDYIAYMYEKGLTTGMSSTVFGSDTLCDAQMFYVFTLRSLGYSDADKDFTYAAAQEFALNSGLTPIYKENSFLRDDMVAIAYSALAAPMKDDSGTLLDKLVADGAVDAAKAKPYQNLFAAYASFIATDAAHPATTGMSGNIKMNMDMTYEGEKATVAISGKIKTQINPADLTDIAIDMQFDMKMSLPDGSSETASFASILVDQKMYTNADGVKYVMPYELSNIDMLVVQPTNILASQAENICYIIAATHTQNTYTISVDMNMVFAQVIGILVDMSATLEVDLADVGLDLSSFNMTLSPLVVEYKYSNNKLSSVKMDIDIDLEIEGEKIALAMDMTMDSLVWSDNIKITKPADADKYIELSLDDEALL